MTSLVSPSRGQTILHTHISQFVNLIGGVSGAGEDVRLTQDDNPSDYANVFGNVDTTLGLAAKFQYGPANSPTTIMTVQKGGVFTPNGAPIGIGVSSVAGSSLVVSKTLTAAGQFIGMAVGVDMQADIVDGAAARFTINAQNASADGGMRAIEAHAFRTNGDAVDGCLGMELGMHSSVLGATDESSGVLYVYSSNDQWLPAEANVVAGFGILIRGDNGFTNAIKVRNAAATVNFRVVGETASSDLTGDVVSLNRFRAGNGTASLPSLTFDSDLDTGIFRSGANTIGLTTAGTQRMAVAANGDILLNIAGLLTTSTSGFPFIPVCAGAPTGVPTAWPGLAGLVYDSTNSKLWVRDVLTLTWKGVVVA